jgi:RNA polymerase sigma-70 factor (ECF subfamily)
MDWVTTSTILDRLRDFQNQSAWGQFAERFRTPLISFARKMGLTSADAEDAAQEILLTFAQKYRNGDYNPAKGRLSHWLFGIAYRQILGARRKLARQRVKAAAGGDSSFWATLPDEDEAARQWDQEWEQALFRQCLQRVRGEVKSTTLRVFELLVLGKRPADEVAAELGMTRNAVFVAKHRVLSRLRALRSEWEDLA